MIEYCKMAREFHEAFDHAIGQEPQPLSQPDREARAGFMYEEIDEFRAAATLLDQVDALLDLAYFAAGTAVIGGWDVPALPPAIVTISSMVTAGRCYSESYRRIIGGLFDVDVVDFAVASNMHTQAKHTYKVLVLALDSIKRLSLAPLPLFEIVHAANMRKLWPDGRPRWRKEDGKVLKPPGWVGPEAELADELKRQTAVAKGSG